MSHLLKQLEELQAYLSDSGRLQAKSGPAQREMMSMLESIVAARRVEEAASASDARRVRALVNALPLGLLITSESGAIEAVNPVGASLLHCKNVELVRRKVDEIFGTTENGLEITGLDADRDTSREQEVTARRPDGSLFPAKVTVCWYATADSPKLMVIFEDVSARHEIERMKEDFMSMVSHDLRSPLTSVQMFLDMLAEGYFQDSPERAVSRARGVQTSVKHMISMINSLLDLHKLESGRLPIVIETADCIKLVDSAIGSIQSLAESRGIRFERYCLEREVAVHADTNYIVQVLVNLIANAVKFSPVSGVVKIFVEIQELFVQVKIVDEGPGIAPEFRQRMFNRFEQASINDHRVKGGSGLGLAIAKAIIEEHGGTMGVDSELGSGSTFWFTLRRALI